MKKTLLAFGMLSAFAAMPAFAHDEPMGDRPEPMADHMMKKMDANNDGMISRDEQRAFGDKMFEEADTNRDGSLSHEEMIAHKQKMHEKMERPMGKTRASKERMMNDHPTKSSEPRPGDAGVK